MNIQNVKTQLIKQLAFKSKVLRQSQRYNNPSTVELRKDIEALDYAIRVIGEYQKGGKA